MGVAYAFVEVAHGNACTQIKFWDPSVRTLFPVRTPVFQDANEVCYGVRRWLQWPRERLPAPLQQAGELAFDVALLRHWEPIVLKAYPVGAEEKAEKRGLRLLAERITATRLLCLFHMARVVEAGEVSGVNMTRTSCYLLKGMDDVQAMQVRARCEAESELYTCASL